MCILYIKSPCSRVQKKEKKKKRTPKCCIQLCKDTIVLENENANAKLLFVHVHFINILTLNLVLMMYIDPAVSLTRTDGQFIWFKFFFWRIAAKKVTEGKICLPFVPVSGARSQTNFFRLLLYLETLKTHTRNLWSPLNWNDQDKKNDSSSPWFLQLHYASHGYVKSNSFWQPIIVS